MSQGNRLLSVLFITAVALLLPNLLLAEEAPPAFPGQAADWHGFSRFEIDVAGKALTVVTPRQAAEGRPWVWHGEFFGHRPQPDIKLLKQGFHIVYLRVPDLFGAPRAIAHWDQAYKLLTSKYQLAKKSALVGLSRGGLYVYNWASTHPERVTCIYADAPVCDLHSWPYKQSGRGAPGEQTKLQSAYEVTDETALWKQALNPIDRLKPLADAGIPLLHVYGDADEVVPWQENTGVIAERYRKLGGDIQLIAKPGIGHVHGLDDPQPIVDFIIKHARR